MATAKKTITFEDTDEGARLYVLLFSAYQASPIRWSNPEMLRRGMRILDARDAISVSMDGDDEHARKLLRGQGSRQLQLDRAEFDLLAQAVRAFEWPPTLVREAIKVFDALDNAGEGARPLKVLEEEEA